MVTLISALTQIDWTKTKKEIHWLKHYQQMDEVVVSEFRVENHISTYNT